MKTHYIFYGMPKFLSKASRVIDRWPDGTPTITNTNGNIIGGRLDAGVLIPGCASWNTITWTSTGNVGNVNIHEIPSANGPDTPHLPVLPEPPVLPVLTIPPTAKGAGKCSQWNLPLRFYK